MPTSTFNLSSEGLSLVIYFFKLLDSFRREHHQEHLLRYPHILMVVTLWFQLVLTTFTPEALFTVMIDNKLADSDLILSQEAKRTLIEEIDSFFPLKSQ